jgi:hypothetical protein
VKSGASIATGPGVFTSTGTSSSVSATGSDTVAAACTGLDTVVAVGTGVGLEGGCSATAVGCAPTCCPEGPEESGESLPHATASNSRPATNEIARNPFLFRLNTVPIEPPFFYQVPT